MILVNESKGSNKDWYWFVLIKIWSIELSKIKIPHVKNARLYLSLKNEVLLLKLLIIAAGIINKADKNNEEGSKKIPVKKKTNPSDLNLNLLKNLNLDLS